jgi:hypothetical protein
MKPTLFEKVALGCLMTIMVTSIVQLAAVACSMVIVLWSVT